MKKTLSALLALGLVAGVSSSAFACQWNKMAMEDKQSTVASTTHDSMEEEAMSTFDPKDLDTETADEKVKIAE